MKYFLSFLIIILSSCDQFIRSNETAIVENQPENKIIFAIQKKMKNFETPARIEVRNYISDKKSKYQADVKLIKKIKARLNSKSAVYLEINLFTNESDKNAPLVAQFMLFDIKTKNLISEENLNLD